MINLLPPESRRNLRAARSNTLLLRYNIALVAAVIFMMLAFGFTYFYLNVSDNTAQASIQENQQKEASYATTKHQAAEFQKNLAAAKQIFSSQVNYSQLTVRIAQALPHGVVLQSLALDPSTFGKPTTLTAYAKSIPIALSLKDTLNSHRDLFQNASIQSITRGSGGDSGPTVSGYPITVTVNVTINPGAAA